MTYIGPTVLNGATSAAPSEGISAGATDRAAVKTAGTPGKVNGATDSYSPGPAQSTVEMSPVFPPGSSSAFLAAEWTQQVQRRAAGAYRTSALLR